MNSHIHPHSPLFAIWTMRSAFKTRPEDNRYGFPGMHSQQIIAAAQYILWDGQNLFKHVIYPEERSQEDMRSWKPGPLYAGDQTLSLDR